MPPSWLKSPASSSPPTTMSAILQAIDKLARHSYFAPDWANPAIRQYLATGDEDWLRSIPSFQLTYAEYLGSALPDPDAWTDEAARVLTMARKKALPDLAGRWLHRYGGYSQADWPKFSMALDHLRTAGFTEKELRKQVEDFDLLDGEPRRPTPAGELFLRASDAELLAVLTRRSYAQCEMLGLLALVQPDRLEGFLRAGLTLSDLGEAYGAMAQANPARFGASAFKVFQDLSEPRDRIELISQLADADPAAYLDVAHAEVLGCLDRDPLDDSRGHQCCAFLVRHPHGEALSRIGRWMSDGRNSRDGDSAAYHRELILKIAAEARPDWLAPMIQAAARSAVGEVVLMALRWWRERGIGELDEAYAEAVRRVLANADPAVIVPAVGEARNLGIERMQGDVWPLLEHKSRPVRGAAARALSGLGFAGVADRGNKLLGHKKAEVRQAAVMMFNQVGGDQAARLLKDRLEVEDHDDVRDALLMALERIGAGSAISLAERQARIAKTLAKTPGVPAAWIKPEALRFKRRNGEDLSADEVRYLLIRQSRCKEMRADLEAKPLFAELDRAGSGDAALALLQGFLGSAQEASDRWTMVVAVLTGDDRLVPPLRKAILHWADNSRGKLAEYAVQALALLGTEAALMVVDSLSVRFRSKNKNIGQAAADAFAEAAETRGVTVEELGDLVVPWLGFEPGAPRTVETSKGPVEAFIDPQLKLGYRDAKTGKAMAKLPAGAPAEVQAEFKTLAATLKEAVKAQQLRIETLLVRQFRWPVDRWQSLYLKHPLLRPFAQRLVWGWRDASGELHLTFRALDDASLTDVEDGPVALPEQGSVCLVHPLDLTDSARTRWIQHLADYAVTPPFPQLDRPVIRPKPEERDAKFGHHVAGTQLNAMTFRSRAEKLGWSRGSVCDAGGITAYRKIYSGAGVEAFLLLEGMYVGIGIEESIELGDVFFVRAGSVQVGSYAYDEPNRPDDPRLMAFGEVPAVPFSETMGDLLKISGKAAETADPASEAA